MNKILIAYSLLDKTDKSKLFLIFLMILLTMFLEMIGIGLIIPLINLLIDSENYNIIQNINFFENSSQNEIIKFFSFILIFLYLLKACFVFIFNKFKYGYLFDLQKKISSEFMGKYLSFDYSKILKTSSSEKIRNLNNVSIFVELLNQSLMLITEFFLIIGIGLIVLWINDIGSIFIFIIIGIVSYYLFRVSKKSLYIYGKERNKFDKLKFQSIQENFFSIKEIKILKKEKFFTHKFSKINNFYADFSKKFEIYQIIPKVTLEFIGILSLCSVIIYMVLRGIDTKIIIINMGIFAAAAFKMIPSLGRIINHTQFISYYSNIVEIFESQSDFQTNDKLDIVGNKISFNKNIIFKNIFFSFGEKKILENFNLEIEKYECIGLIGESGVGKSTLINLLLGLLSPDKGKILIDGVDTDFKEYYWGETIGYVPQFIYLINDTIKRNIAFGIENELIDEHSIKSSIKNSQLEKFIEDTNGGIEYIIDENGKNLSGGQIQRIGIARALYNNPKILILDESTSSLDKDTEESFLNIIKNLKNTLTIIIISHKQNPLSICDKIYKISDKRVEIMQ